MLFENAVRILCSVCICRREYTYMRCSDIEASLIKDQLGLRSPFGFKRVEFVNVTWGGAVVHCRAFEGARLRFEGSCARMTGPASSCRKVAVNCKRPMTNAPTLHLLNATLETTQPRYDNVVLYFLKR